MARAATGERLVRVGMVVGGVVLAAVIFAQLAQAGRHAGGLPVVTDASMYGAMGAARASLDDVQVVKCSIMGSEDPSNPDGIMTASCTVTAVPDPLRPDASMSKMCTTANKSIIAAIQAAGDSRILAYFDTAAGTCKSVTVFNSSEYAPKTP